MFNFLIFLRYNMFDYSKFLFFIDRYFILLLKFKFFSCGFSGILVPLFSSFAFSNVYFDFVGSRFGLNFLSI